MLSAAATLADKARKAAIKAERDRATNDEQHAPTGPDQLMMADVQAKALAALSVAPARALPPEPTSFLASSIHTQSGADRYTCVEQTLSSAYF